MTHLVAHPWDAVADVLPPGGNYPLADLRAEEAEVRELIDEANESEERADELERDADDERSGAEDARQEARELVEDRIRPSDNDLADQLLRAIEPDGGPGHYVPPSPTKPQSMGLVP